MSTISSAREVLETLLQQAGEGPGCPIWKICQHCGSNLPKKGSFQDCAQGTTVFQGQFKEMQEAVEILKALETMISEV